MFETETARLEDKCKSKDLVMQVTESDDFLREREACIFKALENTIVIQI